MLSMADDMLQKRRRHLLSREASEDIQQFTHSNFFSVSNNLVLLGIENEFLAAFISVMAYRIIPI